MVVEIKKGFQLEFPNGVILGFWYPLEKGKKSYDLVVSTQDKEHGKVFVKVGNITNIDLLKKELNI